MAAPFELPDLVDIYDDTGLTLKWGEVPARVVPCMEKFFSVWNSGTNTQVTYISHWVDMDEPGPIEDAALRIAAVHYAWEYDLGDIIILPFGGWILTLRVQWYERRYTNTDKWYTRLWCSRISYEFE